MQLPRASSADQGAARVWLTRTWLGALHEEARKQAQFTEYRMVSVVGGQSMGAGTYP